MYASCICFFYLIMGWNQVSQFASLVECKQSLHGSQARKHLAAVHHD